MSFLWMCAKESIRHNRSIWEKSGTWIAVGAALLGFIFRHYNVSGEGDVVSDLAWEVPIGFLATVTIIRLFFSPYWVYQEACNRNNAELAKATKEISEWNEMYRPKLVLACGSEVPGSKYIYEGDGDFVRAFRIVIESRGRNALVNCQGRLISVFEDGQKIWGDDEAILTFPKGRWAASIHETLPPNIPLYLEVIGIRKDNTVAFAVNSHGRKLSDRMESLFTGPKTLVLEVAITAHPSVSVLAKLGFNWSRVFENSSLTLIEQRSLAPTPPS